MCVRVCVRVYSEYLVQKGASACCQCNEYCIDLHNKSMFYYMVDLQTGICFSWLGRASGASVCISSINTTINVIVLKKKKKI